MKYADEQERRSSNAFQLLWPSTRGRAQHGGKERRMTSKSLGRAAPAYNKKQQQSGWVRRALFGKAATDTTELDDQCQTRWIDQEGDVE